jgi:signal transduction histidine kinase
VWRRRAPVYVFVAVCAVAFVQWLYGERFVADLAILVSLYTVTRRAPRRVAVAAAAVVEVGVVMAASQGVLGVRPAAALVLLSGMVAAAFFLGTNLRTRQAYLAALVERARRLEYERDQQARIAAAAERASIAREMHDIVAHSLSVIITMADAAGLKHRSDPVQAAATMEQVSEVGRQALGETRRLVGVLRTDAADGLAPQPGLDQLDALLQQVRATGLSAELSVSGRRFPVPDSAELASYRIVQEALTNTLKHARGATRVNVGLRYAAPVIGIEVTDDGCSGGDARPAEPTGHGVVGMQERAALYHGTVAVGPLPSGGWAVRARLSLENGGQPGR